MEDPLRLLNDYTPCSKLTDLPIPGYIYLTTRPENSIHDYLFCGYECWWVVRSFGVGGFMVT